MEWSDEVRLETPEQIDVDLELAGLGSRFLAVLVDWLLKAGVGLGLLFLGAIVAGVMGATGFLKAPSYFIFAIVIALLYLFGLGYAIYFEVKWNGQTLGKWLVGIRVIQESGAPVDFRAAAVRNFLALADMLPIFFLLGSLLVLVTSRRQRLGDMAAGTLVIRERVVDLGADPTEQLTKHATDEYTFTAAQLVNLTPADRTVLREFLRRYEGMSPRNGDRLALSLAEKFMKKIGYRLLEPFPDGWEACRFLASLLRDLEAIRRHG